MLCIFKTILRRIECDKHIILKRFLKHQYQVLSEITVGAFENVYVPASSGRRQLSSFVLLVAPICTRSVFTLLFNINYSFS